MNKFRSFFSKTENLIFIITWLSGVQMGITIAQLFSK